jgi:hypothetical protein
LEVIRGTRDPSSGLVGFTSSTKGRNEKKAEAWKIDNIN